MHDVMIRYNIVVLLLLSYKAHVTNKVEVSFRLVNLKTTEIGLFSGFEKHFLLYFNLNISNNLDFVQKKLNTAVKIPYRERPEFIVNNDSFLPLKCIQCPSFIVESTDERLTCFFVYETLVFHFRLYKKNEFCRTNRKTKIRILMVKIVRSQLLFIIRTAERRLYVKC